MSKKNKGRYKRNKKVRQKITNRTDRHHLLWPRSSWDFGSLCTLRDNPYCVCEIQRDTLHHSIHEKMCCIPTPRVRSAHYALEQIEYLMNVGAITVDDPIEEKLELLIHLFDYIEPSTTEALKKQLDIVRKQKSPQ